MVDQPVLTIERIPVRLDLVHLGAEECLAHAGRSFFSSRVRHPMQHPLHFHGQRFLVISRDGIPNNNLVWKDTVLVKNGERVDILLDVTNPGDWVAHCHIPEHMEAGMMFQYEVI